MNPETLAALYTLKFWAMSVFVVSVGWMAVSGWIDQQERRRQRVRRMKAIQMAQTDLERRLWREQRVHTLIKGGR